MMLFKHCWVTCVPCQTGRNNWEVAVSGVARILCQKSYKVTFLKTRKVEETQLRCYCAQAAVVFAVADDPVEGSVAASVPELKQRSEEWHELRKARLTASSFGSALGFWRDGRVELWEEKVGLKEPFAGNFATKWGVDNEAAAIDRYKEITGNVVEHRGFQIYKEGDDVQGWLGASPDGLIDGSASGLYEKGGILEVKCPHNKGNPQQCVPWNSVPYYYIPQVQGLMEILDRDWLDLYVWTVNGSAAFRVDRDPEYWALMFGALSEFWWGCVIPAKQAIMFNKNVDIMSFKPPAQHKLTNAVISQSRLLASKATLIWKDDIGDTKTS